MTTAASPRTDPRLAAAAVLLVGVGGLGSAAALYLAAAGIGQLVLVDGDRVELSNLGRQVIHTTPGLGLAKVNSAAQALARRYPPLLVTRIDGWLDEENAPNLLANCDVVVDGCDNFDTRYLVNQACRRAGRPLVSGAVVGWEGQVVTFVPEPAHPCYRCLYPRQPQGLELPTCATAGVLAPLPGLIGAMMALETVKLLTNTATPSRLHLLNPKDRMWHSVQLRVDPNCPICNTTN